MANDLTLITGASSDIGCALVRHLLATTGRRILAHSFRGNARIAALQQEFGDRILPLEADLSDLAAIPELVAKIQAAGELSAVVHLAALPLVNERFTKFNWDYFEKDLSIQVRSIAMLLQKLLPRLAKQPNARLIFVLSSVVHGVPPKFMATYTIAKYAQLGLMRALAAEYAASQLRVNAISPSMVDTQFLQSIPEMAVQMSAESMPLGRNATPDDLLGVLALLLSPASAYMHGVDIPVAAGTAI